MAPENKDGSTGSRKTALIVEGGAMRGAWAAGVLSFLHERGQRQFDLVYAASSGACSAAYFVTGMFEPGLTIWRDFVCGRKLVCKTNFLRFKPLIDLAYLVDHCFKERVPLCLKALRNASTRFYIVLRLRHRPAGLLSCEGARFPGDFSLIPLFPTLLKVWER